MENTVLIELIRQHQEEGFNTLYRKYSDQVFHYIYHVVNDRFLALNLMNETFSKIKQDTPVINYNTGSVFTWLIEETIQVILENCPEKHGEIRKQMITETQQLNITESSSAEHFSINHLICSQETYFRKSA